MKPLLIAALVFAAAPALAAPSLDVVSVSPGKFLTPNGDGCNDVVSFRVVTTAPLSDLKGRVFSQRGAFVADMAPSTSFSGLPQNATCNTPYLGADALAWDGKDSDGSVALKGVYLYKIQAGGKSYSGTVVVAK